MGQRRSEAKNSLLEGKNGQNLHSDQVVLDLPKLVKFGLKWSSNTLNRQFLQGKPKNFHSLLGK